MTPKSRPNEIAKRVKSRFNVEVTPGLVVQVLCILAVAKDMKAEREERQHDRAMADTMGPHGQG